MVVSVSLFELKIIFGSVKFNADAGRMLRLPGLLGQKIKHKVLEESCHTICELAFETFSGCLYLSNTVLDNSTDIWGQQISKLTERMPKEQDLTIKP